MHTFVRQHPGSVIFAVGCLLAAIVGCILTANSEFAFYLMTFTILIGIVLVVHQRVQLTDGVLWSLSEGMP